MALPTSEQMLPATPLPATADELQSLLQLIYRDLPIVDVITLDEFRYRYRLSGLSVASVTAMERAQRITRSIGDHRQMGVCEFYIGLIYLDGGQALGATTYFAEARRQWDYVDDGLLVCLAYIAQATAQHEAYHYESALASYGRAEKHMPKGNWRVLAPDKKHFVMQVQALLTDKTKTLLAQIEAYTAYQVTGQAQDRVAILTGGDDTAVVDTGPTDKAEMVAASRPADAAAVADTSGINDRQSTPTVPPPIIMSDGLSTHESLLQPAQLRDRRHRLYEVVAPGTILPLTEGDLVLIDTYVPDLSHVTRKFFVIDGEGYTIETSIQVKPYGQSSPVTRIALIHSPMSTAIHFRRDNEGDIKFLPRSDQESFDPVPEEELVENKVLGTVKRIWTNIPFDVEVEKDV